MADGTSIRRAAKRVGVPHSTARSWWRRHRDRVLAAVLMVALGCAAGGAATTVVLRALAAPEVTISQGNSPSHWRSVSVRAGGAWLAPLTTIISPVLEVSPESFHCCDGT